jgi:hypothetical protein
MTEPGAGRDTELKEAATLSLAALEEVRALVDGVRRQWARSEESIIEGTSSGGTP